MPSSQMNAIRGSYMSYLESAKEVFEVEAKAISQLSDILDDNFSAAIEAILVARGRVIVCGMGKSGLIGKKIAATFASTGTPSFFMHPAEAYHGDLGMITKDDVFLSISYSGETEEVIKLLPFLAENKNLIIAMTGSADSSLAKAANFHLSVRVEKEACPLSLAPTSSTTAALVMGDALAVTLMKARDFQPESFARFHPGGALGRRLLNTVEQEMESKDLPFVLPEAGFMELIKNISARGLGLCIVLGDDFGIITDGDLRRAIDTHGNKALSLSAADIMNRNPLFVGIGTRTEDALALMATQNITSLLVKDGGAIVGIVKK